MRTPLPICWLRVSFPFPRAAAAPAVAAAVPAAILKVKTAAAAAGATVTDRPPERRREKSVKKRSLLALLLIPALLAGIVSGCGKTEEAPLPAATPAIVADVPSVPVETETEEEEVFRPLDGDYLYSLEYDTVLYEGSESFYVLLYTDAGIYASVDDGENCRLCFINSDNEPVYLENYAPVTENGVGGSPVFMTVDSDNRLVLIENVEGYRENGDETYTYYSAYYLRTLAEDGTQLSSARLKDVTAVSMNGGAALIENNEVAIASADGVAIYDYTGKKTGEQKLEGAAEDGLVTLRDGRTALYVPERNSIVVLNALMAGQAEEYVLPGAVYGGDLITGAGYYDFCYTCGTDFYGFNLADLRADRLFNWVNSGIVYDELQAIRMLPDGRAEAVKYDWSYFYDSCTVNRVLVNRLPGETDQRTKLTIAAPYSGYSLWYNIIDFNAMDPDYRIELLDYSASEDGLASLVRDIREGNTADIVCVDQFEDRDISALAAAGVFEDLYPFLQADGELSSEDLVPSVLKACEIDGKLFYTASDFSVLTYAALSAYAGSEASMSMDAMNSARRNLGGNSASVFSPNSDQFDVLSDYLCCLPDFVDFSSGEPRFDAEAFITRLNVASLANVRVRNAPADDIARLTAGEQLLVRLEVENATEAALLFSQINRPLSFVGLPMEQGSGNLLNISKAYAIPSASGNKDGAWRFIRTFLTKEYQLENAWRIPVNMEALKDSATARIDSAFVPVEGSAVTAEYIYNAFLRMVESAGRTSVHDSAVDEIARSTCAGYFKGTDSARDAADKFGAALLEYLKG